MTVFQAPVFWPRASIVRRRQRNRGMDEARGLREHEHRAWLLGRRRGALGERRHHLKQVGHAVVAVRMALEATPTLRCRLRTGPASPRPAAAPGEYWCAAFVATCAISNWRFIRSETSSVSDRHDMLAPATGVRNMGGNWSARSCWRISGTGSFQRRDIRDGRAREYAAAHRRDDLPALDLDRHGVGRRPDLRCDRRRPITDERRRLRR